MSIQSTRTKIVAGALAFSLLTGGAATVLPVQSAYAATLNTPFTDVAAGHWAEKHIAKLALQGIVNGYNTVNGTSEFRPANSVTQEEAVVMAIRFAGLQSEVKESETVEFPESFQVSKYFKPFVKLALSKGILEESEEYAIAAGNEGKGWGTLPATREWITKLLVRAIGEESTAKAMNTTQSAFKDDAQIASTYRGYVNAAVSLGLVKGVTADKFDPKAPVNRMSLAALFSRAEAIFPVAYEGQHNGVITKLKSDSVTIYSEGKELTYTIGANTLFYRSDSDKAITAADLKAFTNVTLIEKLGGALYIESTSDKVQLETITAKLDRVNESGKFLYVWINDEPVKIYYDSEVAISDTAGKTLSLTDLKRDSELQITMDTFREQRLAVKLVAPSESGTKTITGLFYNVNNNLITYLDKDNKPVSKFMTSKVTITIDGLAAPSLDDLFEQADQLELTLNEKDQVTAIKVVNRKVETLSNMEIDSYSEEKKVLFVFDASGKKASVIYLTDKTKIDYYGEELTLKEANDFFSEGRKINIVKSGETVISIEFIFSYEGTIKKVDIAKSEMTMLENGIEVTLPLASDVVVDILGKSNSELTDLKAGDKVTATLDPTQTIISKIQVQQSHPYTITAVNTNLGKVTVKHANGTTLEIYLSSIDIVDSEGTKLTVDKLAVGTVLNINYIGKSIESIVAI
ncbi:S-layer homology domain-containing protein [Paenibacillus sp. NEAU-GSW1]|uniref:S-layer homology domain-containing protein n=1 Tax=Paenibacillus sp. NEAU-GSW1 TaxID=2682486 RepID=UPI001563F0A9|nr:S-layer homology domain-containing protein [Paenibacillus sp. NEAU-GSW1]